MYTIHTHKISPNTSAKRVLNTDHQFVLATNQAKKFASAKAASAWYMDEDCPVGAHGTSVWIEGPRGGIYRITNL